jgi:hypothetical protein
MGWTCCTFGRRNGVSRVFVGRPEGKRPPVRPRRRSEDNIRKWIFKKWGGGMDWIYLVED